jgi:hypothetical protein
MSTEANAEIRLGEIRLPSGTLVLADTMTLAGANDDEECDGEAAVIEGLPANRVFELFGTPSRQGPWVDALRLEIKGAKPVGKPEVVATITLGTHEVIVMDCDQTDQFDMDSDESDYHKLKGSIADDAETFATVAVIEGMTIGLAMLALQAVGSEASVKAERDAKGAIVRITVKF